MFHQALLCTDSPLGAARLELFAAYVSGLNACHYCYGVHSETAGAYGNNAQLLQSMLADVDSALIEPAVCPLLGYSPGRFLYPSFIRHAPAPDRTTPRH